MATTTRARPERAPAHSRVDLDAAPCIDVGHHWQVVEYARDRRPGALHGLPIRNLLCMACGSLRLEVLTYGGEVVARWYHHDPAYIDAARALGDHHERRKAYRTEAARRARRAPWSDR